MPLRLFWRLLLWVPEHSNGLPLGVDDADLESFMLQDLDAHCRQHK